MNNVFYYFFPLCIIAIIISIITFVGKIKAKPVYKINLILIAVVIFIYKLFSLQFVFDADGNRYDSVDWENGAYEQATFYTQNGEPFRIQEDMVVAVDHPESVYEKSQAYLDIDGNLVFDVANKYKVTLQENIFLAENQTHVYAISSGTWDIHGRFRAPEPKGILINGIYFMPCSTWTEEEQGYIGLSHILILLFCIISMSPAPVIGWILILKGIRGKVADNVQYKFYKYLLMSGAIFIQFIIIGNSDSFENLITRWILYVIFVWLIIPFIQGDAQIEFVYDNKRDYPRGVFLKDMLHISNKNRISKWRQLFTLTSFIHFICWLAISIVTSLGV